MNLKFSIITVTLNNGKTIKESVESILTQTYKNYEHIVIDGASNDNTLQILQQYRHIKLISEKDNGMYYALNKGIKLANGDIITWLHADDIYYNNEVLEKIVKVFNEYEPDFLYGNIQYVRFSNTNKIVRNWIAGDYSLKKLKNGWMPPHTSVFVKREIFNKYGLYDTLYSIAADYEWMVRVLKNEIKIAYLPEYITKMRIGGKSNNLRNIVLKMKQDLHAIRKHKIGGLNTLFLKNLRKLNQFINL